MKSTGSVAPTHPIVFSVPVRCHALFFIPLLALELTESTTPYPRASHIFIFIKLHRSAIVPATTSSSMHTYNSIALAAIILVGLTKARYTCHHEEIEGAYPYCISIPDSAENQGRYESIFPTILYLPGSGSFGSVNDIEALVSPIFIRGGEVCVVADKLEYVEVYLRWHGKTTRPTSQR